MPIDGEPAGIVSPTAYMSSVASVGVIATIMSPNTPLGATFELVPFGT